MRLIEGETEWEGRLEVCLGRRWGTVSNDGWSMTDAQVVCRDLGYVLSNGKALLYVIPRSSEYRTCVETM